MKTWCTTFGILLLSLLASCSSNPGYRVSKTPPPDKHGMTSYRKGQTLRLVRTTAYSCAENEPGAFGKLTSMGTRLTYGNRVRTAAADWSRYPAGTHFKIKGLPYTYVVEDYGRALVGTNTIDLYHPNLWLMKKWGTRNVQIEIIKWGDPRYSIERLKGRAERFDHCKQMYNDLVTRKFL